MPLPVDEPSSNNDEVVSDAPKQDKPKKKNKLVLIILLIVAALAVVGGSITGVVILNQNGKNAYSSSTSFSSTSTSRRSSTSKPQTSSSIRPGSSSNRSSSSTYDGPTVDVTSVNVVKKSSTITLEIQGTTSSTSDLKMAFALKHYGTSDYIVGSGNPSDSDYKYNVPVTDGGFTFKYILSMDNNVSDGIEPGVYTIVAGIKGYTFRLGKANDGTRVKDDKYLYYIRTDAYAGSTNALTIDELPPFEMSEATITTIGGRIYAKVGGNNRISLNQELLNSYDSYVELEEVGNGFERTIRSKDLGEYFYESSGNKSYVYIDIGFFEAGKKYNTHLNVTKNQEADCKMDVSVNHHYVVTNDYGDSIDIQVYANSLASSDDSNEIYGNLGFIVTAA